MGYHKGDMRRQRILEILGDNPDGLTLKELAYREFNAQPAAYKYHMNILMAEGKVIRFRAMEIPIRRGPGRTDTWRYKLAPKD